MFLSLVTKKIGVIDWQTTWHSSLEQDDYGAALEIDVNGNIHVVGTTFN